MYTITLCCMIERPFRTGRILHCVATCLDSGYPHRARGRCQQCLLSAMVQSSRVSVVGSTCPASIGVRRLCRARLRSNYRPLMMQHLSYPSRNRCIRKQRDRRLASSQQILQSAVVQTSRAPALALPSRLFLLRYSQLWQESEHGVNTEAKALIK